MRTRDELAAELRRLDGRPYPAYKDLRGRYDFDFFILALDRIQGDPFAAPSRLSIEILHHESGLPADLYANPSRRTGTETRLALNAAEACRKEAAHLGSGKSGLLAIDTPGQEMLARTCVEIGPDATVARLVAGLPANGRRIMGRAASTLLTSIIPDLVEGSLLYENLDPAALAAYADAAEDADHLRGLLPAMKLVAFVADGAILPRASGVDDRPLQDGVPFRSPESLRRTVSLPHSGEVRGMGIPEGVTLIVGGGYHGKSTLLNAVERGVYNHCPGDGRELVITRPDAVKVRAEDGRSVAGVNLSPFINNLPGGKDTVEFCTQNASGSTSQAAGIIEALESGSRCLLLDEDISATNFLIRDARMARLIAENKEPITPFVRRVRALSEEAGISTILVLGGSGDYFELSDLVIAMDNYLPRDVTAAAKEIAASDPNHPYPADGFQLPQPRIPDPDSIDPLKPATAYRGSRRDGGRGSRPPRQNIKAQGTRSLVFGREEIDLSLVPQLVDASQVRAIGAILAHVKQHGCFDRQTPLAEALQRVLADIESNRLSALGCDDLAEVRLHEVTAALNRLRALRVTT